MLHRNIGLILLLLLSVVGHATLLEALTHRQEPYWHGGIVLLMVPLLGLLLGGFLVEDGRRAGHVMSAVCAALHLALDAACVSLAWLQPKEWRAGLAAAALGALTAGWLLLGAVRGMRPPTDPPGPPRPVHPLRHELHLWGGTAVSVTLIGACFVLAGLWAAWKRPERTDLRLCGAVAFFAVVCAGGVWMGLERRAALLGQPGPRIWPRRWRRVVFLLCREGLVQRDRRGLTLFRWDNIAAVGLGEVHHNPAVLLWLRQPEGAPGVERRFRVEASAEQRRRWGRRWARSVHFSRVMFDADLVVLGVQCEDGAGVLHDGLERGLADEAMRHVHRSLGEL